MGYFACLPVGQLEEHGSFVKSILHFLCWYSKYAAALISYLQLISKVKIKYDPSMCTCSPESQLSTGLDKKDCDQQLREGILSLCFALVRPPPGCCVQFWDPLHKKDMGLLEQVQRGAT